MPTEPDAPDALWRFCLRLYARPGVGEACLRLQERFGANVPLLLCAAWLGSRGLALNPEQAVELERQVGEWQREVVEPLRRIRVRLKTGPAPARTSITDALRDKVKAIELEAERIEIDHLQSLSAALGLSDVNGEVDTTVENNLMAVLSLAGDVEHAESDISVIAGETVRL